MVMLLDRCKTIFKVKQHDEKKEIIDAMDNILRNLEGVHQSLDYVTDELIIDSLIYEIKSLQKKYGYYLKLCREKGVIAEGFNKIS